MENMCRTKKQGRINHATLDPSPGHVIPALSMSVIVLRKSGMDTECKQMALRKVAHCLDWADVALMEVKII